MTIRARNTLEKGGVFETLVNAFNTLVNNCNNSLGSATGVNLVVADHNKAATDIAALRTTVAAIQTDLAAIRTTLAAVQTDAGAARTGLAALVTAYNATLAKLDADAANSALNDTDYAASNAGTGPGAQTSQAPAALTSSAPAAVTVEGSIADVEAGAVTASETITLVNG